MRLSTIGRIRAINNCHNVDTRKQAQLNEIQRQIAKHFMDTPDYHNDTLVNGEMQELLVSRNQKDDSKKTLIAYPGETFMPGDVVDCFDAKWLITSVDPNQESICRGVMERCNRQLRWQNMETGEIITRWCTAQKPYYSNSEYNKLADVSTREFKIQIPYDDETKLIDLDRRFMLEVIGENPKTYKVTSVDTVTERFEFGGKFVGFLVWNIKQDQYDERRDNKELQICDYFNPKLKDPMGNDRDKVVNSRIDYSGNLELKIGGSEKTFTGVLFNQRTGEVLPDIGEWRVAYSPQYDGKIEQRMEGNKLILKAKDTSALEGANIRITFSNKENTCDSYVVVRVVEAI